MNRGWIMPGILVVLVLVFLWRGNDARSDALVRADALEASIEGVRAATMLVQDRADSLSEQGLRSDSVVQAVRDSADARVGRARGRLVVQRDTLEVLVTDTTALRLIVQRDSLYEGIIASRDSLIVELDSAVVFWRGSSFAKDTVIWGWVETDSIRVAVNVELRAHIRGLGRRSWLERSAAVVAVACAVLCGGD